MRTNLTARPRRELKEFVRAYAQRDMKSEATIMQPCMALLEHILVFDFYDPLIWLKDANSQRQFLPRIRVEGLQTFPSGCTHLEGRHLGFVIFLKPLAPWQLFRVPPCSLANRYIDSVAVFGKGMQTLWSGLAESRSFAERVRLAEEYLLPLAANALASTPVMQSTRYLFNSNGMSRIEDIANGCGLSVRHYDRLFAEQTGMGPKLFARVRRFQLALDAKRIAPNRSWLSVAYEFGYFDQMHMIRDFQSLGGNAPTFLLQQIGDLQPWSLGTPMTPYDFPELTASTHNLR
jgi:AraC-like DNA-binding protein